jgi:hypothetical protein
MRTLHGLIVQFGGQTRGTSPTVSRAQPGKNSAIHIFPRKRRVAE